MTKTELFLIHRIAKRAYDETQGLRLIEKPKVLDFALDLLAVHERMPLLLQELLDAPPTHFMHDLLGIRRHLNRTTRQLEDNFVPRYAAPERKRASGSRS